MEYWKSWRWGTGHSSWDVSQLGYEGLPRDVSGESSADLIAVCLEITLGCCRQASLIFSLHELTKPQFLPCNSFPTFVECWGSSLSSPI